MKNASYEKYAEKKAKKSPLIPNCVRAFLVGGLICAFGQGLYQLYGHLGLNEEQSAVLVPVSLVFLACLFTGIGWYDRLAKHAGAGTLVPITGFANAMASPAIDNKAEGAVLGLGAKMFIIAGPVIVYGVAASILLGLVLAVLRCFGVDISYIY